MAIQGGLDASLSKRIGVIEASAVVHVVGLISLLTFLAIWLLFGGRPVRALELFSLPWYLLIGGVIGAFLIAAVAFSVSSAGAVAATTAIVTAQVLMAAALDHFGLLGLQPVPFTPFKFIGVALVAGGTWILLGR
ncbi:MAG TPA: DMT family transporter [Firmicutes bacterium]|nr:DMT family transporter [Bacillota bacterium]